MHPEVRVKHCRAVLAVLAVAFSATAAFAQQRELSKDEQVAHVLSRLTFGARMGDAGRIAAMGVDRWIEAQLKPDAIADSGVVLALSGLPPWSAPVAALDSVMSMRGVLVNTPVRINGNSVTLDSTARRMGMDSLAKMLRTQLVRVRFLIGGPGADLFAAGKIVRAQESERQLLEVITDFWENHFSVYSAKMPTPDALAVFNRDAIRPRALGKFRDLLGAVAHSPAMLFYLDNHLSVSSGLNENYARELLELHTLGVDGGYTQQDVIEVARALTGWSIDPPPGPRRTGPLVNNGSKFAFFPASHDSGAKVVLGRTLPAGRGVQDGEDVLDIVARHPSTARYIATKLVRRLVSDDPPAALVDRATQTFTRTDGDIAEVVRAIVMSDEFFSRAAFRAKAKSPFEYVVSARRSLNALTDSTTATAIMLRDFGQPVFGRISPDGWPDASVAWISAGSLMKRVMFASDIASDRVASIPVERWEGWARYSNAPAKEQADAVVSEFLGGVASKETRALISATGTDAGQAALDAPARLRGMIAIALGSPEFQRR